MLNYTSNPKYNILLQKKRKKKKKGKKRLQLVRELKKET